MVDCEHQDEPSPGATASGGATRRDVIRTAGLIPLIGAPIAAGATQTAASTRILVAAASDLQLVLPRIAAAFRAGAGFEVAISFGSTGNIARQIRQGAPFEVFLAADERFLQDLARDRVIPDAGIAYARGRLAWVAGKRTAFTTGISLNTIAAAATAGQSFRLAIANPEHAPYGQRALEVIDASPAAHQLRARLVYGETVTQAHQMVASGAAAVGLSAMSLATASDAVVVMPVDEALHTPLVQRLAVTARGGDGARAFATFMTSRAARELLAISGFALP